MAEDRFSKGTEELRAQAANPAAPAGAQQLSQDRFSAGTAELQSWSDGPTTENAQGWFTGANTSAPTSGWDTDFVHRFSTGWGQALEQGTARDYFDSGTGVVTWDHTTERGRNFHFGDIVEGGKVTGNVYDLYDQDTANLMMLPWLDSDGTAQQRLVGEKDPQAALESYVTSVREENAGDFEKALGSMAFQADVKSTQQAIQSGAGDEVLAGGGGALGGAITGASAGAALTAWLGPGAALGAAVGGAVGAAVGGIGGLMNKDELSEQAARAYEISKMSYEDQGFAAGTGTALSQFAGLSTKFTSPLGNLAHGTTDVLAGDWGDGETARYAVDDKGELRLHGLAGAAAKVADWSAMVGDGLLQFASPLNRLIYTGQMAGQIGGEVGQLAFTGTMFDPREGGFDNIFVDDNGNFDPLSAAAGIGKIGIDAVQLAGWRGLARQMGAERAALAEGHQTVELAGHRFVLNAEGRAVESQRTLALLAPSEQVAWGSAARDARVKAMKEYQAGTRSTAMVTTDDFYRAAHNLHNGSNRLKAALVNGFGEGYEEAAQAILEPLALDGRMDFGEISSSFAYGVAGGLGMSLGAAVGGPTNDQRMSMQAYVIESLRRGEEPDKATWDAMWKQASPTQKRVLAARTPVDAEMTRKALDQVVKDQTASMVASEADAAKAIDARRSMTERDMKSASGKTDTYQVMAGQLDAGRVDKFGALLGDTAHPEALDASALTVHRLLEDRLKGFGIQAKAMADREAELRAKGDTEGADAARAMVEHLELARAWGANFVADVAKVVDRIYAETTTATQAQQLTRTLNKMLADAFSRRASLSAPEGFTGDMGELADAAAQFVSLLHSREPKLDTGSYVAMVPRADWTLTRTRSDNFLQVNTDILQAINGDFDGDKLRAENQLILPRDRFLAVRAGQNFTGAGSSLDFGIRNFEEGLVVPLGKGLVAEPGQMRDEADATLDRINTAIQHRYGHLMSPEAMSAVLDEFRTAVLAGSEEARLTLMNGLAREASQEITDQGRATLTNEWLWISKVVRANFQEFQTAYHRLRNLDADGRQRLAPSAESGVADVETGQGTNRRKDLAVTDAQTLALFATGNTQFRKFQKIHYTVFNSAVLTAENAEQHDLYELAKRYEELSRGVTRSELSRVTTDDTIAGRVLVMLSRIVDSALKDPDIADFSPAAAMTIFANVKVKDVQIVSGEPVLVDGGQDLSLVQLLLKRALEADREEHAKTFDSDEKLQAKHARLRAMTVPNKVAGDVNAEKAFIEVFGAVPFQHALAGMPGALAPHTTPEQWLRNYVSHDSNGRADMARLFTNVPEYLNRKERSNLPYSWAEAARREVSPYRSMMDAMIAVGNASLTFDPSKPADQAFGGDMAQVSRQAQDAFVEGHQMMRQAMADFRTITNRGTPDRAAGARLAQQMLEANPQVARAVLDLIPNSAANAVYEYRDEKLFIAPWVYEMFAIENAQEALFFYWKNLTLAQWNATQLNVREDDSDAPGRAYNRLQSRFQRLLYQLAKEPGQAHLELLLRKMKDSKNLDQFFVWLNSTPGFRGQQAVLLPFHDDVADFEADAGGGWVTIKAGSDLRQAMSKMSRAATQLRDTMRFREQQAATDKKILDGLLRARNNTADATDLDRENLRKFTRAVEISREMPRGFAPSAMLALTQGVLHGFDAQSHDKGKAPTTYEAVGEFQALMDAFAFVPGLERVMEVVTAHSMDSLRTNLGDVGKHGGTGMDANGREITWAPLTVDQALEMLGDSRTAPLAHALLTPAALDVGPTGVSERLLMEASLQDLLDDAHYKRLFDEDAANPFDTDMRYLFMVDARARAEGGSFDAIRAANDRAIARTSGLGRPATAEDLDRLKLEAYREVAAELRMVARVQSNPDMRNAGTLPKLRQAVLEELRKQRMARALPGFTDKSTGEVVEAWVESALLDLQDEHEQLRQALDDLYTGDELLRRRDILDAQYARNEERVRAMLDDNLALSTVRRFEVVGDPVADRAARAQIVDFVRTRASFPTQAPEAAEAWANLANQLEAGKTPDLSTSEWDKLSRAAMGVYLVEQTVRVSSHVSLPPFPKGDPAVSDSRFFKYFDPSFSFLATDLLDENSPLTKAAVWLHQMAEQPSTKMSIDQLTNTLRRTVLNREGLGTWTPGLAAQIITAHERMDSAAAPGAIAAAGNGPKRWAAVAAATRRTGKVPGADLLTPLAFSGEMLTEGTSRSTLLPVQPAGQPAASDMPLAMLDNRFFATVKVDGADVALDDDNLGFRWDGADEQHPYRYISLDRLRRVVEHRAQVTGVALKDVTVEVEFFHPDSQPADPEWMNNAFFEGMSHTLAPDNAESLIATLWSDNGGQVSKDTQWPLDAGKKGLRAIQPFKRPGADELAKIEDHWNVDRDLAALLRAKTELLVGYDDGAGAVAPEYFNALYKHMKLSHIVVGRDESGQPAALTAEQVIALGAGADLGLADARLVRLSPDVLRTMLGETGDQGVRRFFDDEYLVNASLVQAYTGISAQALDRFGAGWVAEAGSVADTSLAHVGAQRALTVRTMLTDEQRSSRNDRIVFLDNQKAAAIAVRHQKLNGAEVRDGYKAALQLAQGAIEAEARSTFAFGAVNSGYIAPRDTYAAEHSVGLLEQYKSVQDPQGFSRGWRVVDEGGANYPGGVLTLESLGEKRDLEHTVVKDDLAVVELQSFDRPERTPDVVRERLEKALRYLANSGATIALGSGDGRANLRFEGSRYLESLGYEPVAGSRHLYAPAEFGFKTQNERAHESTLAETKLIRPKRNAVTFLAEDPLFESDENVAIGNPDSQKLKDRRVVNNLLLTSGFPNYNVPVEDNLDNGLFVRTLDHLRTVLNPANTEARAALLQMGGRDPERVMPLRDALDRFHAKISNSATLEPKVGDVIEVGDIIPLVHPDGRVLLYRHGFKLPRPEEMPDLLATGGMNVAVAKSETESAATANSGVIVESDYRIGYGRSLALEIPLQQYGDKVQLDWNGMKYVVAPPPEGFKMPQVFGNGTVVDLFSDLASADSKEAFEGRVAGYRNALAFFQFDFTDDLVKFFYPNEDPKDPESRMLVYSLLHRLANQADYRIPFADAAAISKAHVAVADLLSQFAEAEEQTTKVPAGWIDRLQADDNVEAQIARAVITYLLTPGAHLDNVLSSAGFSHPDANGGKVRTRLVPGIFADLLDQGLDSPLHKELIRRFDAQLHRGADGSGFRLGTDWRVQMFDDQGGYIQGYLQFGPAHSSGDNPVLNGQANDPNDKQAVSPHNALAAGLSVGADTAHKILSKSRSFARSFKQGGGVSKAGTDSMWQMLTALPDEKDAALAGWRRESPAESLRREAARDELVGFYHPLDTSEWSEAEVQAYEAEALKVLDRLHLHGSQRAMVDTWVRQQLGRPYGLDEDGNDRSIISAEHALEVVTAIRRQVAKGHLPTAGGNVPLMDVNHLTTIYLQNQNREDGWAPRTLDTENSRATSWDAWVETAFGSAFADQALFDSVYLLAVDGLMHGYQNATTSTRYLPVSSDALRNKLLMDEETNRMVVSISEDENLLATDPTLWHASSAELDDIIGGQRIYGPGRGGPDPASAMGAQRQRMERWRKEVDAPRQAGKRMRGVRAAGQTYLGHTTTTSALFRSMINLRAGNVLFNVGLMVSAVPEAFVRRTINTLSNVAVGESTGAVGQAQSRLAEALSGTTVGKLMEALGVTPTYTPEQLTRLNDLVDALSTRSEFKAMVYKELMYQFPTMPGIGKVEKVLERYAKFGGRMQDPAWGMLPKDLARIYVETLMRKISQSPTGEDIYSVERLLTEMTRNPGWVQTNDLEGHNMAIAAIAQIRSLKPNVVSLATRGVIEPLTENHRVSVNAAGNMLKVLTLFQNFWANFGISITGMQGAADFAAFWFDGREKKITARMQAALRGEHYNPTEAEYFDMSEVLESMDLADSFIKGGVTHSALFALGLMAGGLGLSGDDDELKFRRRQAELQGVPLIRDPRQVEEDFRNKDAIYLDWLPLGLDSLFKSDKNNPDSRAMAQMNWVLRTFLSPVLGFERFYETGDFMEIFHGFKDAIGAHPIVNEQLWNIATDTAAELHTSANEAAEKGDMVGAGHKLITAVSVLERMLIENSMINMIYQGRDEWDRDPYVLPLRDSDGTIQRDIEGNARENDLALQTFLNPESGELDQGYLGRSDASAALHTLTENRAGAALIMSLFTGGPGGSDYWRYNMPIKTRSVDKAHMTEEDAKAVILDAFGDAGGLPRLTADEIAAIEKNRMGKTGDWSGYNQLDSYAAAKAKTEPMEALSEIRDGREHLTEEGARAVFRGLAQGTVKFEDASLHGVYITGDMRAKIQEEWTQALVQEGVDLGLTHDKAVSRMKRLWGGQYGTEEVGLGDLLWLSPEKGGLSYHDSQTYGQLNTTYVMGPDGRPWATGFHRDGLLGALGLKPLKTVIQAEKDVTGLDGRLNTVDLANGMDTGLRALRPLEDSRNVPTDEEIGKSIEDAIKEAASKNYTQTPPYAKKGSGYGGYGYRRSGGSGGGGGAYFSKMYTLPRNVSPYGQSASFINTSNPIIRRAFVRRERVWSERGRLKQWQ